MRYPAIITVEGHQVLAEFPDCPGCCTFADPGEDIAARAADALQGSLESMHEAGEVIRDPSPDPRVPEGGRVEWIEVPDFRDVSPPFQ